MLCRSGAKFTPVQSRLDKMRKYSCDSGHDLNVSVLISSCSKYDVRKSLLFLGSVLALNSQKQRTTPDTTLVHSRVSLICYELDS